MLLLLTCAFTISYESWGGSGCIESHQGENPEKIIQPCRTRNVESEWIRVLKEVFRCILELNAASRLLVVYSVEVACILASLTSACIQSRPSKILKVRGKRI